MKSNILILAALMFAVLNSEPIFFDDVSDVLHTLYSQNYTAALEKTDSLADKYPNTVLVPFLKSSIYSTYMSDYETDTLYDSLMKYSEITLENHDKNDPYQVFFAGGAYLYRTYFYVWKTDYKRTVQNGLSALKYFNKSIAMNDKLYDGYLGRGIVNYFIDRFKDKVPFMSPSGDGIKEISLAADSGIFTKIPALDVLAMLYQMEGKYPDAERISSGVRKEYPENRMFMFTQIKIFLSEKKYFEAASVLEELEINVGTNQKRTFVNQAYIYYNLSECYFQLNERQRCRKELSKLNKLKIFSANDKKVAKFIKKGEELSKKLNENE